MRIRHLAAPFLLCCSSVGAQDVSLRETPTRWRIGFEQVDLKRDDTGATQRVGLLSVHYDVLGLLDLFPPLYIGAGGYADVTGKSDGLLLAGLTAGTQWKLHRLWTLDTGLFVGGGGGTQGATDTGFLFRPFAAIERSLGPYGLRAEMAYFDMDGHEGDLSLSVGISLASELLTAREHEHHKPKSIPADALVRHEMRVTPRTLWLRPSGDSRDRRGDELDVDIGMVGLGVEYYLGDRIYIPVEFQGAVRGGVGGFLLGSAGLGVSVPVIAHGTHFEASLSAVTGGGGTVATGGGFGWHARAGLRTEVVPGLTLEFMGGAMRFPSGDFDATTASLGLSWSGYPVKLAYRYPRGNLAREALSDSDVEVRSTRLTLESKFYSPPGRARRKSGGTHKDTLPLLGVGVEEPITEKLSATAHIFASVGGGSGGYTEGLLGLRYEYSPFELPRHHFGVAAQFGAAGGADVDVRSGLIYHLSVGWRFDVTDDFQASVAWGKVEANHGAFQAESVSIGGTWNFSRAVFRE